MKPSWKNFERRTLRLLSKHLQADYSAGGPTCKLHGFQIDAYAIFGQVPLIVECKTVKDGRRINVNYAVDLLAGRRARICSALQKKHGRHLRYFRFVIIVGNASEIVPYNRRRRKPKDIFVWTPKYFDAIERLAKGIRSKAVPYILRELRVKNLRACLHTQKRHEVVPAIRVRKQGRREVLYSLFAPARALIDLCYVARVESDQPDAYQRVLNESRLRKIQKYINDEGSFKNSVVLSLPPSAQFRRKAGSRSGTTLVEYGLLKIPYVPASLWIIDGQHRIYGFLDADSNRLDTLLSVVAVQNISNFRQGRIFVDINGNQKPVNPNLLWDLYSRLYSEETTGKISQLVKDLTTQRSSALYRKIFIPGTSSRSRRHFRIFLANVCEAIDKQAIIELALNLGTRANLDDLSETRVQYGVKITRRRLNALCKGIRSCCRSLGREKWWDGFFLSNNGISILIRLFRELLIHQKVKWSQTGLAQFLREPLKLYFERMNEKIDEVTRLTSSEAGRDSASLDLFSAVREIYPGFAESRMKEAKRAMGDDPFRQILGSFEKAMRQIIREKLSGISANWWAERMPPDVKDKAEATWARDGRGGDRLDRVDFSDYIRIISNNWKDCFEADYIQIQTDKNVLNLRFRDLTKLRNRYFHFHGSIKPSEGDIWQARILSSQILQPYGIT